ncbi:MAG: efflux RND transporter periplasmic adaptor subunit, partial [Pseudomonadota bacterium]
MSDQVPRSDRGKQGERSTLRGWLSAAIVATVVAGSVVAGVAALNAQAALDDQPVQRPLLTVDAATLQMVASYQASQRFIGRIEPARETQVAFELSGIVREMRFDEGDRVRSNDVVAILDTDALSIDRARLMAERSALEADLALAEATTLRREALQGRGFESGQSFDEARFSADAVRAQIAGVDARLNRIALDIEKSSLRAPFDGVVSVRSIDEGAVVGAGASVLTLQETTRPQARIGVPVEVAQMLELGALL